jgi:peptidoglycan/LPS O-acetylase OafA/YrhL
VAASFIASAAETPPWIPDPAWVYRRANAYLTFVTHWFDLYQFGRSLFFKGLTIKYLDLIKRIAEISMTILKSDLTKNSSYIPGIDGLRALAVISVIIFHLKATLLPGGFSGVDIFFVISGYVVSSSLVKYQKQDLWNFLLGFYARRLVRIYPALLVCLFTASLFHTLLVPSSWLSTTSNKTAMTAFFGLSNFALIWFSDGYFSPRVDFNTFTHTWSLAVEEQFYLIFPFIFFIWFKGRDKQGWVKTLSNSLLGGFLVASLIFSWYQTNHQPDHAFYLLPSRFWELACGALLFRMHHQGQGIIKSAKLINLSTTIGLVIILWGFIFCDPKSFPFPWAILPVVGTIFLMISAKSGVSRGCTLNRLIENNIIVFIGKISYSLYLWHWPVFAIFRWTLGLDDYSSTFLAIALTIILSVASYYFIECPTRTSNFVTSQSNKSIVLTGIASIVVFSAVSFGIFISQNKLSLSVTRDAKTWYPHSNNKFSSVDPSQAQPRRFEGRKIFVLGDSHTGAYGTMLQMLKTNTNVIVKEYSMGGCAVANFIKPANIDCLRFIENTMIEVNKEARPGDIVFLASLRMNRLSDQWVAFDAVDIDNKQNSTQALADRAAAFTEAEKIIARFEALKLTVMVDAPKPVFKSPPFRCSDWFNTHNSICKGGLEIDRSFLLNHRQPVMASLSKLTQMHPKLMIWDPFPLLCSSANSKCKVFDNGYPQFFDGDHLSGYGNRKLYPHFLSFIGGLWPRN